MKTERILNQIGVIFVTCLFILISYQMANAADKYIVRGAKGTGSSWSDPMEMPSGGSTFCASNAGTWERGTVYWVAGSDTAYNSICFRNTSGSGAITIKKATASSHGTDTGWSADYGTKQAVLGSIGNRGVSDVVIDGSTGSGRSGYGFKIIGNAGSSSYGIGWPSGTTHNNLTVRHVEITSPNTPISTNCVAAATCTHKGLYLWDVVGVTLEYLWIHDVGCPFHLIRPVNFVVSNSIAERNDSVSAYHSEAFSFLGGTNVVIKNNEFVDIEGTAIFAIMNGGAVNGLGIYNNIIRMTPGAIQAGTSNGLLTCTNTGTTCSNIEYYNNTHVNIKGYNAIIDIGGGGTASAWTIKNNLWWCGDGATCANARNEANAQITYDRNWYGGVTYNSSEYGAMYQATENPFVNSAGNDFKLKSSSTAILSGVNLSNIFTNDYSGVTRPASGNWSIGAYESISLKSSLYVASMNGTVTSNPSGINCGSTCYENFDSATSVTLTAVPNSGYAFSGWSGGGCSGTGACIVSMDSAKIVTANYAPTAVPTTLSYKLSTQKRTIAATGYISSAPVAEAGTVTSNDGSINCGTACNAQAATYVSGKTVTLTATPSSGYSFYRLYCPAGSVTSGNTCTVTMDKAKYATAVFRRN